ncbi:succinic semialdehyde dehydrogenase [Saccharomonospora viridis]|jgi:succinate-semialdehyde dehydrogenase/glutarate-semialdehyde dehydrogenase|uniref:NAD-dependent aldehyde dehydrogenase n=2 Tax=Saccharomonospora viridis TaxID=1852 RepID=C7MZ99_SACVD|nr:succinic semialdehyde dehydrogenase [Saccharomonospora viridis]ACU97466.1 NAD-dependent aldehyde dehydrogenase [Saccharomonospora viridis DSM 43017]KHF43702.1 succinate-semialdehyde dehydrogenase [Saccharomonospora viridis]SFP85679.1 succinate-semialdehyde dehydrogenase / glutarate-semialdehyde dehydrogenase [Saccharomonospora viridis]
MTSTSATTTATREQGPATIGGIVGAPSTARAEALVARVTTGPGSGSVTVTAPFTERPTAVLPQATDDITRAAFARARRAQPSWATTSVAERQRILLRLHELVLAHQDEGLDLIQVESGKARLDAFDEISATALVSAYYGKHSARLLAPRRAPGVFPLLTRATHIRHPRGVVGVISPWNYPLALTAMDVLPALVAGNTVVQKPDNQTALSALWLHELAERAGLPRDAWQIVLGRGSVIGTAIAEESDYLCFTGSTPTGKKLASAIAGRLTDYSLELGGKNPMIVLPDADVAAAAAGAVTACFSSAGQLCVSVERIYVHDSIRDRFLAEFVQRTRALRLGASLDYRAGMGSLTTAEQLRAVSEHVANARAHGATVVTGGRARPDVGPLFYEPTILTDVTDRAALFADETFGPVVSVYGYTDVDDAIERANDTPFGLNASVWSRDTRRAQEVATRLRTGTVNINEGYAATFGTVGIPMGGMKESGVGRRNGADGLLKYTESQSIAVQHGLKLRPMRGVPPTLWTKALSVGLRVLRRIPGR